MEFAHIGTQSFAALALGAVLGILLPLALALVWVRKKHEPFKTVLVGAVIFFLFVTVLEKPIQALVITGEHPVAAFLNANPVWWALVVGLFPGVFEETGRLFAFKAILKNRKNRETAISYGIGHGGMEVVMLLGVNYAAYLFYAAMINAGTFGAVVEQAAAKAPAQAETSSADARAIPRTDPNRFRSFAFFAAPMPGTSSSADSRIARSRSERW